MYYILDVSQVVVEEARIMRVYSIITGILCGWWCALAIIAPPPSLAMMSSPYDNYNNKKLIINKLSKLIIDNHNNANANNQLIYNNNYNDNNNQNNININQNKNRVSRSSSFSSSSSTIRSKSESSREKRKQCNRKNGGLCRGNNNKNNNWCPDMDLSNRAYLAPTVFEGKARSMSSSRKPGSNYAVTFEVKQVYKSQSGFQPLKKNDSVRLHFRDKIGKNHSGKYKICNNSEILIGGSDYVNVNNKFNNKFVTQSTINDYDVTKFVRADIKRGKVYIVFVNRVGPRNFTILGEPVIRNKKNEQTVQAVVRPDYGS